MNKSLLTLTSAQIRFLLFLSISIAATIVLNKAFISLYAGYENIHVFALSLRSLSPFLDAFMGTYNHFSFLLMNHAVHDYPVSGILLIAFIASPFRFLLISRGGIATSISIGIAFLAVLGHFFLYGSLLDHGFWERDSVLFNTALMLLTIPALLYLSLLTITCLIYYSSVHADWQILKANLDKNSLKLMILMLSTIVLLYFLDQKLVAMFSWVATAPIQVALSVLRTAYLFGLVFYIGTTVNGSQYSFFGVKRYIVLYILTYALSTVLFGFLYSSLRVDFENPTAAVLAALGYYGTLLLYSGYAITLILNAVAKNVAHIA